MKRFGSRAVLVLFIAAFAGLSFLRLLPGTLLGYSLVAGAIAVTGVLAVAVTRLYGNDRSEKLRPDPLFGKSGGANGNARDTPEA
jgi:hypothetical protein